MTKKPPYQVKPHTPGFRVPKWLQKAIEQEHRDTEDASFLRRLADEQEQWMRRNADQIIDGGSYLEDVARLRRIAARLAHAENCPQNADNYFHNPDTACTCVARAEAFRACACGHRFDEHHPCGPCEHADCNCPSPSATRSHE